MTADDRQPGGSGAGSTVELDLSDFAQHVVTSEWLAEVKAKFTRLQMDLAQSRATEAELRAKIEELKTRLPTVECRLDEWFSGGCPCDCHPAARAALDAAEPPQD